MAGASSPSAPAPPSVVGGEPSLTLEQELHRMIDREIFSLKEDRIRLEGELDGAAKRSELCDAEIAEVENVLKKVRERKLLVVVETGVLINQLVNVKRKIRDAEELQGRLVRPASIPSAAFVPESPASGDGSASPVPAAEELTESAPPLSPRPARIPPAPKRVRAAKKVDKEELVKETINLLYAMRQRGDLDRIPMPTAGKKAAIKVNQVILDYYLQRFESEKEEDDAIPSELELACTMLVNSSLYRATKMWDYGEGVQEQQLSENLSRIHRLFCEDLHQPSWVFGVAVDYGVTTKSTTAVVREAAKQIWHREHGVCDYQ